MSDLDTIAPPPQMDIDEARTVARRCAEPLEFDCEVPLPRAKQAVIALAAALEEARLARACDAAARSHRPADAAETGEPLRLGEDHGGPRHFLGGEPVHAGEPLLLLTADGWLRVRYEWSFRPAAEPLGYVTLPGAFEQPQAPLRLPPEARFRRPTERR